MNADASYNSRYTWVRGTKRNDGSSLGNVINSNRNLNINGAFNSEISRSYYELQERDLENMENQRLPLTFNEQFLWNRDFSLRWDRQTL